MLAVAAVGLGANLVSAALLFRQRAESLNVRAAFLHVVGDAAASVGVIIAGIIMLTTGQFIPAEKAEAYGLINKVVPADRLEAETMALAEMVASKLGAAVKIGKEAFYRQMTMSVDQAYAYAGEVMVENMLYRDTEEGISAFLEKRSPDWSQ